MTSYKQMADQMLRLLVPVAITNGPGMTLCPTSRALCLQVVPWHQDNSYWEPRIWDEQVLSYSFFWIFPDKTAPLLAPLSHRVDSRLDLQPTRTNLTSLDLTL